MSNRTTNRTAGEASLLLHHYETLNKDLPADVRRQLGLFYLASKVGRPALEELFERPIGTTPWVHVSWFWWNCMRASGLERLWDEFAIRKNSGSSLRSCLRWVRRESTPEEWALLSRRVGAPILQNTALIKPGTYSPSESTSSVWTKGGVWDKRNSFTRIIILGEKIEGRDYTYSHVTRKLNDERCWKIEREIRNFVDENSLLYPDALMSAVAYAKDRLTDYLRWPVKRVGPVTASWFFQRPVPVGGGLTVSYKDRIMDTRRSKHGARMLWFPV